MTSSDLGLYLWEYLYDTLDSFADRSMLFTVSIRLILDIMKESLDKE
jgi:hypothetical protein